MVRTNKQQGGHKWILFITIEIFNLVTFLHFLKIKHWVVQIRNIVFLLLLLLLLLLLCE